VSVEVRGNESALAALLIFLCLAMPASSAPLHMSTSLGGEPSAFGSYGASSVPAAISITPTAPAANTAKSVSVAPPRAAEVQLLQQLAGLALMRNPQLRDSESAWYAARMDTEEVKGSRWPRLDVTATSKAKMLGTNPYGTNPPGRVGLMLTLNLFDGGKTGKQISAKEYQEQVTHARYLQVREQTIFDTATVYLQISKFRKLVALHQQNVERLTALVDKMDQIVRVIAGRRSELTQAMSRLLQAKENRAAAEAKLGEYKVQLLKLIGQENLSLIATGGVPHIDLISPENGFETAKKSHPTLQGAKAEHLSLNDTATAIRRGNYWPTLDFQVSKLSGTDIMGFTDPGQAYINMKWNLFQGFSGRAQEKAVLERANAAQEKYEQALLDIEYKLNSAWTDYQNQHERVDSLRALATNTEQVRNDYYIQWESLGKRSLLEVLTAENEHISTLVNLVSSEHDEQLALAKLRFESGTLANWLFDTPN